MINGLLFSLKGNAMKAFQSVCILVLFLSLLTAGCTKDPSDQIIIPIYPGAEADEEYNMKGLGVSLGMVKRVVTSDSYEDVLAYYVEKLKQYNPEILSHEQEDIRQTAFTVIENEKGSKTVAVQEFKEEGVVAITYMRVGL